MLSDSYEQSDISTMLNSLVVEAFGIGIYTVVYFGTLYAYITRRSKPQTYIVVAAITFLYLFSLLEFIGQWWHIDIAFVQHDETQDTIYTTLFIDPLWWWVVLGTCRILTYAIADALLLWRCFHVWGKSIRVLAFPSFLWVAGNAILVAGIIKEALSENSYSGLSPEAVFVVDNLQAAGIFIFAINSVFTSLLIAYRIHCASSTPSYTSSFKQRFNHIIDIVVQSTAAYSFSLIFRAISTVIQPTNTSTRKYAFDQYSDLVIIPIIGIAPTVMVARVALARSETNPDASTPVHFSGLQFNVGGSARGATASGIRTHNRAVEERSSSPHNHHEKGNKDTA